MSFNRRWTTYCAVLLLGCGFESGEPEPRRDTEPTQQPATGADDQESLAPAAAAADARSRSATPSPISGASSWAVYHRTIESLVGRAQVAVRGKVESVEATVAAPATVVVKLAEAETWWTKPATEEGATIGEQPVVYTQGASGAEADPLREAGEDIIVFFEFAEDGTPRVSGGPSGRFVIRGDVVLPVVSDGVALPVGLDVRGFRALVEGDSDHEWRQPAPGSSMTIGVGQTADVLLKTLGLGHYDAPVISSDAVALVGSVTPRQYTPGGATQVFRLVAKNNGEATVTFTHSTAADGKPPLVVTLNVRS